MANLSLRFSSDAWRSYPNITAFVKLSWLNLNSRWTESVPSLSLVLGSTDSAEISFPGKALRSKGRRCEIDNLTHRVSVGIYKY